MIFRNTVRSEKLIRVLMELRSAPPSPLLLSNIVKVHITDFLITVRFDGSFKLSDRLPVMKKQHKTVGKAFDLG